MPCSRCECTPRFRSRLRVGSGELSPPVPVCAILAVVLLASVGPDGAAPAAVHNRDLAPAANMWRQILPPGPHSPCRCSESSAVTVTSNVIACARPAMQWRGGLGRALPAAGIVTAVALLVLAAKASVVVPSSSTALLGRRVLLHHSQLARAQHHDGRSHLGLSQKLCGCDPCTDVLQAPDIKMP